MSKSLKNIGIVASATVLSRVLGLGREIFLAAVFGTSALNSAFITAFTLPNLFRRLLGEGALTAAFVPTMTDELEKRRQTGAFALLSKVTSWLALITIGLVLLATVVFANADALLASAREHGLGAETASRLRLGADLAVVLFPYLVFVCLAAAFSAACQVLGRFTEPALSPIWLNLAIIGALAGGGWALLPPEKRMYGVCAGVLVGGFFQMAVPAGVLLKRGWRPRLDLRPDARVREIAALMTPMLFGSAIYLVNIAVSRFIGLSLNDSAATVLNLSTRVMELPIGVFTAAIATVVFPLISRHASRGDWPALGNDYHKGLRLVLLINIPAAAGLALLSQPIVRQLFQRGEFGPADTQSMTPVLAIYALGLPFLSFTSLALRGFYALKDTATPVRAAALSFVVNLAASLLLMRWLSTAGLALASGLAVLVQACYLQRHLSRRQPALAFAPAWRSVIRIAAATAIMGVLVWLGWTGIEGLGWPARARDLLALAGLIPAGAAVYGALLWWLRIEGREELRVMLRRILAPRPAAAHVPRH